MIQKGLVAAVWTRMRRKQISFILPSTQLLRAAGSHPLSRFARTEKIGSGRCGCDCGCTLPNIRQRFKHFEEVLCACRLGRRWKVERLFAWLQNFRRLVVRYERCAENFLGMLYLACCVILLRYL